MFLPEYLKWVKDVSKIGDKEGYFCEAVITGRFFGNEKEKFQREK